MAEKNPRILLGKVGLDGHDRGVRMLATWLRDSGMEVVYIGTHNTPDAAVKAAEQEDVDFIGLSFQGFFLAFLFLFAAISSHGLLDTLTNGGLGIALLWPWSEHRYFMPFHPIEVAPLGLSRFLSERGLSVLKSELYWVWLPAIAATGLMIFVRLALTKASTGGETARG